jgi:hypothetical protein
VRDQVQPQLTRRMWLHAAWSGLPHGYRWTWSNDERTDGRGKANTLQKIGSCVTSSAKIYYVHLHRIQPATLIKKKKLCFSSTSYSCEKLHLHSLRYACEKLCFSSTSYSCEKLHLNSPRYACEKPCFSSTIYSCEILHPSSLCYACGTPHFNNPNSARP